MVFFTCAAADAKSSDNGISGFQRDAAAKDHNLASIHLIYAVKSSSWLGKGGKLGVFAWHHGERTFDGHLWHTKGLSLYNLNHWLVVRQDYLTPWYGADRLMARGDIEQTRLADREYDFRDVERAMEEASRRERGFLKAILKF